MLFKAAATTASFSTGLREHVEYTIRGRSSGVASCLSMRIARCRILSCSLLALQYTKYLRLKCLCIRMKSVPLVRIPPCPNTDILPQRPISRAGHIGKDPIELEGALLISQRREHRRVEIRDHQASRGQSRARMHEQMRPFLVRIVRDQYPRRRVHRLE